MVRCIQLPIEERGKLKQAQKISKAALKHSSRRKAKTHPSDFELNLREEHLLCPICLEVMVAPAITPCGHASCLTCLEQCFSHSIKLAKDHRCPICRTTVHYYDCSLSSSLAAAVEWFIEAQHSEQKREAFAQRERLWEMEERRRFMCMDVGRAIDFFDVELRRWRQGCIAHLELSRDLVTLLCVQPTDLESNPYHLSQLYYFRSDSRRLAIHRTHTLS